MRASAMSDGDYISLFDSTLRDGAQTQGVDFAVADKLALARALDRLGLDYVEGGWPGANPTDDAFFAELPALGSARLVAFGMTRRPGRSAENDPGLAALVNAKAPVICMVGKAWDFQVEVALGIGREENLAMIADSVAHLAGRKDEVLFDAEHFFDGYKADPGYAMDCAKAAYGAGARWVVLCDTNGGTLPDEIGRIVETVTAEIPGTHIAIHCHNDTENAVANSLVAVKAGARQIQGTLNGLGERCGNANLVSLIPTLMLKTDWTIGVTEAGLRELTRVSRLLDERLNRAPNRSAAYVGDSAFAHKGGLHGSAVEKDSRTYEHVDPALVGNRRHIVVSDQAGRSNILARFRELDIDVDVADGRLSALIEVVKAREFEGYAYDGAEASFELLARRALGQVPHYFKLSRFRLMDDHHRGGRGGAHGGGDWKRPGERARYRDPQGALAALSPARGHAPGRLQGAHPDAPERHRRHHPGHDRKRRHGRAALDHRGRLDQHHRRLIQRAARRHHLEAHAGRGGGAGASVVSAYSLPDP
jgi:2-isopropylmalate synthase